MAGGYPCCCNPCRLCGASAPETLSITLAGFEDRLGPCMDDYAAATTCRDGIEFPAECPIGGCPDETTVDECATALVDLLDEWFACYNAQKSCVIYAPGDCLNGTWDLAKVSADLVDCEWEYELLVPLDDFFLYAVEPDPTVGPETCPYILADGIGQCDDELYWVRDRFAKIRAVLTKISDTQCRVRVQPSVYTTAGSPVAKWWTTGDIDIADLCDLMSLPLTLEGGGDVYADDFKLAHYDEDGEDEQHVDFSTGVAEQLRVETWRPDAGATSDYTDPSPCTIPTHTAVTVSPVVAA